jgi:hypothetical protein
MKILLVDDSCDKRYRDTLSAFSVHDAFKNTLTWNMPALERKRST